MKRWSYLMSVRQRSWELIDRKYPEENDKYQLLYRIVEKCVLDLESANRTITILDAGCGHATMKDYKCKSYITYLGLDLSTYNITNNENLDFGIAGDLSEIPVKNNSIDIIVSAMVLEHLDHPKVVFNEFHRILRPNGFLVISTPCIYNIVTIFNSFLTVSAILQGRKSDNLLKSLEASLCRAPKGSATKPRETS